MAVMERVHGRKAPSRSQRHRGTGTADPIPHEPLENAMNKIYRIVWNATIGKWVVASELATRRGKSGSSKASVKVGDRFHDGLAIDTVIDAAARMTVG
jgi:hypothetical protein